ncbi:DCC1-like thiol-disulfide oxidoreductase family protein [Streptosporangium sp. NPDC002524]|uniref:thiol-disulfide oxidoreductase DCC family protein n=1 Tax=Streptosporangium sp. NPDC002524 TaxID=3154537 RepID=UPI003320A8C4
MKGRPLLVFDGDCGFCLKSLAWLRRRVAFWPETVSWQAADLDELGLTEETCAKAIQWIDEGEPPVGGALAFAALFRYQSGPIRHVGTAMRLAPLRCVAQVCYRLTARNRHRLPGATAACSIEDRAVVSQVKRSGAPDRRRLS